MARKDKTTKKLEVRTEKLRRLDPVEPRDLGRVAGGLRTARGDTTDASTTCPTQC